MSGEKIFEGVLASEESRARTLLAVNKPQGITSADVLRDLQKHFNPSKLFRPWLAEERAKRSHEGKFQRKRRKDKRLNVKIGHGGTLDPLATGVLIAGVGKGTKDLPGFLGCTKTYEAILLFGAETDTYDRLGKVVKRAPYEHITREAVEKALETFRGKIMQRPPIFSALRIQGKRLYDYAREGIEPPVEIAERPVEVSNLEILEWYDGGKHEHTWPKEELANEEKAIAEKMLAQEGQSAGEKQSAKRKPSASPPAAESSAEAGPAPSSPKRQKTEPDTVAETETATIAEPTAATAETDPPTTTTTELTHTPPAVKITMTVSSGFYVRSLCHDVGKAVGSCGMMSELVRSRQADFELGEGKVLEYKDLDGGEEVWGPKVQGFLEAWVEKGKKGEAGEGEGEEAKENESVE